MYFFNPPTSSHLISSLSNTRLVKRAGGARMTLGCHYLPANVLLAPPSFCYCFFLGWQTASRQVSAATAAAAPTLGSVRFSTSICQIVKACTKCWKLVIWNASEFPTGCPSVIFQLTRELLAVSCRGKGSNWKKMLWPICSKLCVRCHCSGGKRKEASGIYFKDVTIYCYQDLWKIKCF